MNFKNIILEYYPIYLEALVSIIMFYTLYLIFIKYINLNFMENIFKTQIETQLNFYDLHELLYKFTPYEDIGRATWVHNIFGPTETEHILTSSSYIDNPSTRKDRIISDLKYENNYIKKNYNTLVDEQQKKNKKSLNNLIIFISVILSVLVAIAIIIPLFGLYKWKDINYKTILFAIIFHTFFIISLESFLLFVIMNKNSLTNIGYLFEK